MRISMCQNKVSFRTQSKANAVANLHGQRVYECPICFCWHCTSKQDWRHEYVDAADVKRMMATLECKLRTEFNEKLRKKNFRITELERENKRLRYGEIIPETSVQCDE